MNPAVLFAAPIALAALYLTFRSSGAAAAIDPNAGAARLSSFDSGEDLSGGLDFSSASHELPDAPDLLAGAGAVFESIAAPVRALAASWALPARGEAYAAPIREAETRYGLPESMLARLLNAESGYRPEVISGAVRSTRGATGIAQFMPGTAAELGIDATDASQSIDAAAKYLRSLYNTLGTWPAAIAAYNWGIGNVQRKGLAAAPAETRAYVATITKGLSV